MPNVIVLPDHIASQIAAGEVVERPAAVVKELVENAIDAGSSRIEIAIASDCRDMRVADDGCGMAAEDAVLAFHRHATSKLKSAEDLAALSTLGFRGEALPSIASVAKVTCLTRCRENESGTRVEVSDGQVVAKEAGCAVGTIIEVTDLFYNVPARLKFLKKANTEFAHIHETVQSLALAYPALTFVLINEGEIVLKTSGSGSVVQAAKEVGLLTGKETVSEISYNDVRSQAQITGYVARAPHCRGDRKGILSLVNKRPVRCPLTYKALEYAFSDLIPRGRHPLAVISINLDPALVDVNIHPAKKEIRYSRGSDIYLALQRALNDAVRHNGKIEPDFTYQKEPSFVTFVKEDSASEPVLTYARSAAQPAKQLDFDDQLQTVVARQTEIHSADQALVHALPEKLNKWPASWRLSGYIHNTYMIIEDEQGMLVVEQHIAHERFLYEKLLQEQVQPGRLVKDAQKLLATVPLQLSPAQAACLQENLDCLKNLGFDFSFAGNKAMCTQIPIELSNQDHSLAVQNFLEDLLQAEHTDFALESIKSLACQAAIKNGMPLSQNQIIELLANWHNCPRNESCPHGRPIALSYSKEKLFQLFHPV